jgi:hypothetical protein
MGVYLRENTDIAQPVFFLAVVLCCYVIAIFFVVTIEIVLYSSTLVSEERLEADLRCGRDEKEIWETGGNGIKV